MHVRIRTMRLIYYSRRRLPIMRWLADGVMSFWLCFAAFSHSFSQRVTASRCYTQNNTDSWRTETQAALPQSLSRAITRIFCMDLSLVKKSFQKRCYVTAGFGQKVLIAQRLNERDSKTVVTSVAAYANGNLVVMLDTKDLLYVVIVSHLVLYSTLERLRN